MNRLIATVLLAVAATGCTTLPQTPLVPDQAGCQAWTQQLDEAVASAGVADAEAERIAGVAGLRVDRTGVALRDEAAARDDAFAAWLQRAAAADEAARSAEIANLPDAALPLRQREDVIARTDECRRLAVQQLQAAAPAVRAALLARATVPDRYSVAARTLGLYPLLRWPFFAGVQRWQHEHEAAMARWAAAPPPRQRHTPPATGGPPPPMPAADALGLPQPSAEQAARLLAWHAPVLEIEQRGTFDRFGALAFGDGVAPRVDTARPVVYQRIAHTRLGGRWRLQLVYTLWFPERPAAGTFDILAGALDGVVVRLTLGDQGEPLLVDSIHACGCYHLFFPAATLRPRADAPRHQEWLFAPAPLPPLPPTHRLVVRVSSASHDVLGVHAEPRTATTGTAYALQPEAVLRSLPAGTGRRNLYGPDGLVAGSERGERFLFWPMGIASAGAMRQWGHHATAFVGRRHFDDPDLIEARFEFIAP